MPPPSSFPEGHSEPVPESRHKPEIYFFDRGYSTHTKHPKAYRKRGMKAACVRAQFACFQHYTQTHRKNVEERTGSENNKLNEK